MRRSVSAIWIFLLVGALNAFGQDILTADQFFSKVADRYSTVDDYEATLNISTGKEPMVGKLIFKSPSLLRIDFSTPADQVIVFDGSKLVVYLPQYKAVLQQDTGTAGLGAGAASLASREGLSIMRRNYTVAWEKSPSAEALDPGSSEMVNRLMLTRKNVSEGFKAIRVSIDSQTLLIRRIEGWTVANDKISFDFTTIKLNQGISANRFIYDAPASANVYNNFLFQ